MRTPRQLLTAASCCLLIVSISATRGAARSLSSPVAHGAPAACTLLTTAEATKAMEVPSQPGKEFMDPTGCMWWSDAAESDTCRRIAVNTHSLRAFQAAMHPAITTIQVEPVSGVGDQAFYQIYPHDENPFIWVRKGNDAFSIRIITRLKPRPFTQAQEKAKDLALAKAAAARF